MPRKKSALKKIRQDKKRHLKNLRVISELKTLNKKFIALLTEKKKTEAEAVFKKLSSRLDKARSKGIIHKNKAFRKKSRLAKALDKAFKS